MTPETRALIDKTIKRRTDILWLESLHRRRDFALGWQLGESLQHWTGRLPAAGGERDLRRLYTQNNKITGALKSIEDGAVGREPTFTIAPNAQSSAGERVEREQMLEAVLGEWFNHQQVHALIQRFAFIYLWAGMAGWRMYIPDAYQDEVAALRVARGDLEARLSRALDLIHAHVLEPWDGAPIQDEHGRVVGHYYTYTRERVRYYEVHLPDEIVLLDDGLEPVRSREGDPQTYANFLRDTSRPHRHEFLMYHAVRDNGSMVTETAISLQSALNRAQTHLALGDESGAFRSVFISDAEVPTDAQGRPTPWSLTPASVIALHRALNKGVPVNSSPGVTIVDPLKPDDHGLALVRYYEQALDEHFLRQFEGNPRANVSGLSREIARDPSKKAVITEGRAFQAALKALLERALRFAFHIIGDPAPTLSVTVDLALDPATADMETFKLMLAGAEVGLVSVETLVAANPLVPPENRLEEIERVKAQLASRNAAVNFFTEPLAEDGGLDDE